MVLPLIPGEMVACLLFHVVAIRLVACRRASVVFVVVVVAIWGGWSSGGVAV